MSDITEGIRDYLASGGLFNPEMMDHQRVRDLVIECRDEIEQLREAHEACSWQLRNVLDSRDARDTEIERLRELLQWWLDAGPDADWDDYERRVCDTIRNAR